MDCEVKGKNDRQIQSWEFLKFFHVKTEGFSSFHKLSVFIWADRDVESFETAVELLITCLL